MADDLLLGYAPLTNIWIINNLFWLTTFESLGHSFLPPWSIQWRSVVSNRWVASNQILVGQIGKKIIDLPVGQINEPLSWKKFSLPNLPATPSSLSYALVVELQRNKDTVRCAALGPAVPGQCQHQLTLTLIVRLLKHACFRCSKNWEGPPWPPLYDPLVSN